MDRKIGSRSLPLSLSSSFFLCGVLGEKIERLKVLNGRRRQESLEGKRRRPFALSRSQKKFVFLRSVSTGKTFSDLSALE